MYLNGVELEYVDRAEYLGVLLSQGMKDDADMNTHLRSFYARSNVIFRKFHYCSASIKVNLIKTYCAPYCSQLSVNHTKCSYTIHYALPTIALTGRFHLPVAHISHGITIQIIYN